MQDLHGYGNPWPEGGGKNKFYFKAYSTDDYVPLTGILNPAIDVANQTLTMQTAGSGQTVLIYKHNYYAGQYAISFVQSKYDKRVVIRCFDANGEILTNSEVNVAGGVWNNFYQGFYLTEDAFTVPNTVDHFWIGLGVVGDPSGDTITISKVQLEYGSAVTTYAPYSNICSITGWTGAKIYHSGEDTSNPTIYEIAFPSKAGTVYGGTLDVTTGELVVDMAMQIFDGSEEWVSYPDFEGYYCKLSSMKIGIRQDGISNYLKNSKSSISGQKNSIWLGLSSNICFLIGVYESMGSTLEEFKAYLSDNNLMVVYPLASSITYTLTSMQINTLLGVNNIWSDAGNVSMNYVIDVDP